MPHQFKFKALTCNTLPIGTVANTRTPLKGCVRVRSPYTREQCSQMFVFVKNVR